MSADPRYYDDSKALLSVVLGSAIMAVPVLGQIMGAAFGMALLVKIIKRGRPADVGILLLFAGVYLTAFTYFMLDHSMRWAVVSALISSFVGLHLLAKRGITWMD